MTDALEEFQVKSEMKDDEEIEYLKPEIIYHEAEYLDSESQSDAGCFNQLGPLVEFVYDESEVVEYNDHEYNEIRYVEQTDDIQDPTEIDTNATDLIQPMMPFFLSSSHIFADDNDDQNEGETIILQIEEEEPEQKKVVTLDDLTASSLQSLLCSSKTNLPLDTYTCEVCEQSYGCLNCLKSHYETMHVGTTYISHYKCKYSTNTTKGLCCPVCELTFDTRSETMDHYITHAVACDTCGSGFDRQHHLTEHRRKMHNKGDFDVLYDCELCGVGYQYPRGLSKHYQKVHKIILCVECKLRYLNATDLQEHETTHREKIDVLPYACSKCDKAFAEISEIAVHLRQDHNHKRKVEQFETVYVISQGKNDVKKLMKKKVVRFRK